MCYTTTKKNNYLKKLNVFKKQHTLCRSSNAYSKPAVKLAIFSHLTAFIAVIISFLLSGVARTYNINLRIKFNSKILFKSKL